MSAPDTVLAERFSSAFANALGQEFAETDAVLRPSGRPDFGYFQANFAMGLAKTLGKNPREVAQLVLDAVDLQGVADHAEVAGPGFINITLSTDFVSRCATEQLNDDRHGVPATSKSQRIVIDYSQPNIAKEMHVGHVRSTVIGDSLARLFEFLGHNVIRQNHLGDWGTPYGMIIEQFLDDGAQAMAGSIDAVTALYRRASARYKTDEEFAARASKRVVSLQAHEPETIELWNTLYALSLVHIEEMYQRLGVTLTREHIAGESSYDDDLPVLIEELRSLGLAVEQAGALCVFVPGMTNREGEPLPVIVQKSDGGYLYATTDLATVRHRVRALKADRALYVVDSRQSDHFVGVFAVARLAHWIPDNVEFRHVAFGTMLGPGRTPLKTRSGEVFSLEALLDEAEDRALAVVQEKSPDLDAEEQRRRAHIVGIGAIKFADLVNQRTTDYVFDWDRMLALQGKTAPYLQYAHARIRSLLRTANEQGINVDAVAINITERQEHDLALALLRFPRAISEVEATLEPHHLCMYLFELAQSFTAFYEACPVFKAPDDVRDSRLRLAESTSRVLKQGLVLLGIDAPEQL